MTKKTGDRKTPAGKSVTLSCAFPGARSVALAGSFNKWNPKTHVMKKNAKGVWTCSLKLGPGRYEYRLVLNGSEWVNDPSAKECCPNDRGGTNCVLRVT